MDDNDVQQASAWLKAHKPHTFEEYQAMDDQTKQLRKHNMNIIRAHLDAWLQQRDPMSYALLLAEAMRGI